MITFIAHMGSNLRPLAYLIIYIISLYNISVVVFVTKLLRNGWTYFKILCSYRVGFKIGQHLLSISLNETKSDP